MDMLLGDCSDLTHGIVIFDAFRCSSTLLACFASGLYGAVVMEKGLGDSGTSIAAAQELSGRLGLQLAFGGELGGQPIPGAVVGNSPMDAWVNRDLVQGRLLHFQSTNFARVFVHTINSTRRAACGADIYIVSFANAATTASLVRRKAYNRIFLISAGFFECIALEDMVLGGLFASTLDAPPLELDDDALAMLACHKSISLDALAHSWTARVLTRLSRLDDVADLVGPSRFPRDFVSEMARQLLRVEFDNEVAVIRRLQDTA